MCSRRNLIVVMTLGLLCSMSVGLSQAQGVGPQENESSAAAVDTAFRYQGRLTDGSTPADGEYDFVFGLYDSVDGVTQVGTPVMVNDHMVSEGLFTVELDFGDVFDGKALWLAIMVRPGASGDTYTTLAPRQPLTAAPYALSLMPGAEIEGDVPLAGSIHAKNTNSVGGYGVAGTTEAGLGGAGVYGQAASSAGEAYGVWGKSNSTAGYGVYGEAPQYGVYGEATRTSNFSYGVYGKAASGSGTGVRGVNTAVTGNAFGVYGSTASPTGYAGYFSNGGGGVDVMAAGSGVIKSEADSVLYLSPHDMVVRGSTGVSVTPIESGGADVYFWTSGWKYLSLPVSTFGTLFGAPVYVKGIEVCYETEPTGMIGVTAVQKNNGGTGASSYINDGTDRTSATYECYTVTDQTPSVIDNSTWVQFNIQASDMGHTKIYTVKLTLTEAP